MSGRDLGTYHVIVDLGGARSFVKRWNTSGRFTGVGTEDLSPWPSDALLWSPPVYESEEAMVESIIFMFIEGNYSCDCNLLAFAARARGEEPPVVPCGESVDLLRLTLVRPDGTRSVIWAPASP